MFTKLFKKDETADQHPAASAPQLARAPSPPPDKTPWQQKLAAAQNDDDALLTVAKEAPFTDIKLAAVQALAGEASLKLAEREFRNHDRRVYREAKQRLEAKVLERETQNAADSVIASAEALLNEAQIPANRLVETDRAWQALAATHIAPAQHARYAEASTKLSALARDRGDAQLMTKRWLAEADRALIQYKTVAPQVAEGMRDIAELAAAHRVVESVLAAVPQGAGAPVESAEATLRTAQALTAGVESRVALLAELQALATDAADAATAMERWQAIVPLADAPIATLLDQRFSQWQRGKADQAATRAEEARQKASEQSKADRLARNEALGARVANAEAALGAGHLAETIEHLNAIEKHTTGADRKLQERIEAVQAEVARLRGWQHWGGGRVRDDLANEAEALAKAASIEKLSVKAHGDAIEKLRERWKELDKLGAATNKTLWQRFDTALKTAYLPVAAHLAKLKEARQQNLEARNKLIAALDGVMLVDATQDEAQDWRALARALEQFQTDWRKLGPVEHTVPHKSRNALDARHQAATERLDAPLRETRRVEQLKRRKLIERATALAADSASRDVVGKVRELQTEWQQHAKALPLARNEENKLWAEFKAATDGVFTQRDAVHAARDAELKTHRAARESLIARLAALAADTPAAELKRTIGDVEREWRNAGEAPRAVAAKLDAKFREARDTAQRFLAGSGKRIWDATCDALVTKLALCEEIESGPGAADIDARWQSTTALPATWEKALLARFKCGAANASNDGAPAPSREALNAALLKLEAALDIESLPAFQAARRELKLRAMKNAMEARQSAGVTAADIDRWLAEAFGFVRADEISRQRLAMIVAALKEGTHRSA